MVVNKEVGLDAEAPRIKEEIPHDHLFKVTGLSSSNLEKLSQVAEPSDFEAAIAATGYGRFNLVLMLCSLPAFWSAVSVTSSVSYIFTTAQCDMNLSLVDMGTINAITYGGMISSALIWGFLSDTLGRRCIMAGGFFCTGLVEVASAMSQSFPMLLLTRFASGFLFNGPFAVLLSYLAEMHRKELRARVILLSSLFYTFANITIPLLAWGIITKEWHFKLFEEKFVIHSWNLFLLATAVVPLLTGVAFLCLPESPKFLMSRGRNEEAMKIFRKMYSTNTGNPPEEYPIKVLVEEKSEELGRGLAALRGGAAQLAPLFRAPYVKWLVLICSIHVGSMFGSNTLRLWYPQLAAMLGSSSGGVCAALQSHAPPPLPALPSPLAPLSPPGPCSPLPTDMGTYLQSAAVGAGSVITYSFGGALINRCGKKIVICICGLCGAAAALALPLLSGGAASAAGLAGAALAATSLLGAALTSVNVDLFPTSLRVMAMAIFLMTGRLGTVTGTVTFPALITYGCLPPFIAIATVLTVCGTASCLLPNTTLKKLE